jgi:DNA-binding NtrC family response regulator
VDLIISDNQMPGMSGLEFLGWVMVQYPDVIRIVLSGETSLSEAIAVVKDLSVYRFISKPCDMREVIQIIRQALAERQERRACPL